MKKCVIICNPNSGKHSKKNLIIRFKNILLEHNYETTVYFTKYSGHAKKITQSLPYVDLVISLGGDGTCNEVVTGNLKRGNPLVTTHIPLGTTNDLGAMFGLTERPINNLKLLLNGKVQKIDLCTVNGEPFVYVAAFGKFANIPYETPRQLKKHYGQLAYILEGLKSFRNRTTPIEMTYEINGQKYHGLYTLVMIANATRIGGFSNVFSDVKLDDNKFEVLFCNITTKRDMIKSFYYLTTNTLEQVPGFYFHRSNKLKITFYEHLKKPWCIDGEKLHSRPLEYEFKIINGVKMLLPSEGIDDLFLHKN